MHTTEQILWIIKGWHLQHNITSLHYFVSDQTRALVPDAGMVPAAQKQHLIVCHIKRFHDKQEFLNSCVYEQVQYHQVVNTLYMFFHHRSISWSCAHVGPDLIRTIILTFSPRFLLTDSIVVLMMEAVSLRLWSGTSYINSSCICKTSRASEMINSTMRKDFSLLHFTQGQHKQKF